MVNTLYSTEVAVDALCYACEPDRLGILALTKSLCSKAPADPSTFDHILGEHRGLTRDKGQKFHSVHEFVAKFVLPNGNCICVVNEDELENLVELPTCFEHGETRFATLGNVIEALKRLRGLQNGSRDRAYVTLGPNGSVVLDETMNSSIVRSSMI